MESIDNTNVPESEPLAETQTEEIVDEAAPDEPIKTVNTFWERLDEVLLHLEETPQQLQTRDAYKSALNQPRQLFCCSTQDYDRTINGILTGSQFQKKNQSAGFFDSFRVSFTDRALLNVKSIQLYSASIPMAQVNITDNEIYFWFYKIPTLSSVSSAYSNSVNYSQFAIVLYLGRYYGCFRDTPTAGILPTNTTYWYDAGTDGTDPNWFALAPTQRASNLKYFNLEASYESTEQTVTADLTKYGWNKIFDDYSDLLTEVNRAAGYNATGSGTGVDEVYFSLSTRMNRFEIYPVVVESAYYFLPPFSDTVYQSANSNFPLNLNMRLGFTEQIDIPDVISSNPWTSDLIDDFTDYVIGYVNISGNAYREANSYPNLNYTNRVNVFADVVRTSSFDTYTGGELLASVPMNAGNLGVVLYNAVYPNKLVNVPPEIYEIFFYFETDNKIPYLFPKSATISLELALEYF